MKALRLLAACLVLGFALGGAGAAMVVTLPIPAKGAPRLALLRNASASGVDGGGGPVWILAMGSDARPGEDVLRGNGDSLHLIGVNPDTGATVVLGIPRDSYVPIPGRGSDKINAGLALGGPQLQAAAVAGAIGITPQYLFLTSFEGLQSMVDRMGGVDVDVDMSMHDSLSGADFEPGHYHFVGGEALAFSRDRHLTGGDFTRSKHQGDLLLATLKQIEERSKKLGGLELALEILLDETITDVPPSEIFRLSRIAMRIDPSKVFNCVLPGSVGAVGAASVVILDSARTAAIVDEVKNDATLKSGCPPIPQI